jgi:hypothetical protein
MKKGTDSRAILAVRRSVVRFPLALAPVAVVAALVAADASADPQPSQPYTATPITVPNKPRLDPSPTSDPTTALGGQHRLVAYTDWNGGIHPRTGWVSTINNGASWQTGTLTTVLGATTAGRPSAAWSPNGAVYMAYETDNAGDACDQTAAGIDLSVSTNAGTAATAAFGSTTRVAIANGGIPPATSGWTRTWPSVAIDGSTGTTTRQPLVAFTSTTAPGCSATPAPPPLSFISVAWPSTWSSPNPVAWTSQSVASNADPDALDYPSLVAVPGTATTTVAVAYLHRLNVNAGQIEASVCTRSADLQGALFNCNALTPTDSFTLARQAPILSGVAVTSAPSLAIGPDGTLHLAYTVLDSGNLEVLYSTYDTALQRWTAPVSVAAANAKAADQFMPSVSIAPNGRADVAYLDDRMDPDKYAAFQTSFRAGIRGDDVRLSPSDTTPPTVNGDPTVGSRMGSMTVSRLQRPLLGHAFAYWSQVAGTPPTTTLYEGELWHGLSAPTLTADAPNGTNVAKNTNVALPASWFAASDADGDPVTLGVGAPDDGGAISPDHATYTPRFGFAGTASFLISATDTLNSPARSHRFNVIDSPPVWQAPAGGQRIVRAGTEGVSVLTVPLAATDSDPGDTVTYAASVPAALAGHVHFTPATGPASTMTIELPRGYRPGTATINVHARDTSPLAGGDIVVPVVIFVTPSYAAPTVNVQPEVAGLAAQLNLADVAWSDPDAPLAESGVFHYHFEYSIDDQQVATTTSYSTPVRQYRPGLHRYTVRVWISTPTGNTPISKPQTGTFAVKVDPRSVLKVRTARRGGRLVVSVTSKVAGTVRVALYTRGLRRSYRDVTLRRGVTGKVRLPLAGIRARSGIINLAFNGGFQGAGGAPAALVRRVWFR